MNRPSWQEFANLFSTYNEDEQLAINKKMIADHPEQLAEYTPEEDYSELFYEVFAILLDSRESIVELVERCSKQLGCEVLSIYADDNIDPYDAGQLVIIYKGEKHSLKYASLGIDEDDFDEAIRQLQTILADEYYLKLFTVSMGDTLEFLIIPIAYWVKAEQIYGKEQLTNHFINYDDTVFFDEAVKKWRVDTPFQQKQAPIVYSIANVNKAVAATIKDTSPASYPIECTANQQVTSLWQRYKKAILIVMGIMLIVLVIALIFLFNRNSTTTEKPVVDCVRTIDNAVKGLSKDQAARVRQLMKKQLNCE